MRIGRVHIKLISVAAELSILPTIGRLVESSLMFTLSNATFGIPDTMSKRN
jgi:hypothetical protein